MALDGRFGDHHAVMYRLHLDHILHLEETLKQLDAQFEKMMRPFQPAVSLLATIPGVAALSAWAVICEISASPADLLPHGRAAGLPDRDLPRQPGVRRQALLRETPAREQAPAARPGRVRLGRRPPRGLPQVALPPARDARLQVIHASANRLPFAVENGPRLGALIV
jgi:hypothetical protein